MEDKELLVELLNKDQLLKIAGSEIDRLREEGFSLNQKLSVVKLRHYIAKIHGKTLNKHIRRFGITSESIKEFKEIKNIEKRSINIPNALWNKICILAKNQDTKPENFLASFLQKQLPPFCENCGQIVPREKLITCDSCGKEIGCEYVHYKIMGEPRSYEEERYRRDKINLGETEEFYVHEYKCFDCIAYYKAEYALDDLINEKIELYDQSKNKFYNEFLLKKIKESKFLSKYGIKDKSVEYWRDFFGINEKNYRSGIRDDFSIHDAKNKERIYPKRLQAKIKYWFDKI